MPLESSESGTPQPPVDSSALRHSSLLGHRRSKPTSPEKPPALIRAERPVVSAPASTAPEPMAPPPAQPEPPVVIPAAPRGRKTPAKAAPKTPAPKAAKSKTPAKVDPEILALQQQLQELREALNSRPGWDDFKDLELRLLRSSAPPPPPASLPSQELEPLRELLQTRQEELEELSSVVSEFQEQNEQAEKELSQLRQQLSQREKEVAVLQQQLEECLHVEARLERSESLLREALLGLLSPGDEYNEELVEQIQHFLSL